MEIIDYIKKIKKYNDKVYVFGAGHVAKILFRLLHDNGIDVECFLVSDIRQNQAELCGKSVFQANIYSFVATRPILIGVLERNGGKIKSYLEKLGFIKIVDLPNGILECDSWEYKRFRTPVIEVTAKIGCAVNCRYCPQKLLVDRYFYNDKHRKKEMSIDDYKRYIDKCPASTIVDFSGFVEPFLAKDSIEMMEYTYRSDHEMTLFTTLRGLSFEQAKRVLNMPFRYVCLHTPDKDGYANIPLTDEYIAVLKMFLDAKKENGEPFVDVANCQSSPHPQIIPFTQGKLKIYCEMSDRAGNIKDNNNNLTHVRNIGNIYCTRALELNHNVLLPDGSLVLCCNDFGLENILGDLNEETYAEIMKSERLRSIKLAMHMDKQMETELICRKCMFARKVK